MLTPGELLHVSEGAEQIAELLHQYAVNAIIQRILIRKKRGEDYKLTAIDKWQLESLREAGILLEDIQQEINRRTPMMLTEIAKAMEYSAIQALAYDDAVYRAAGLEPTGLQQSPHLIRLLQRNYNATAGEWKNFTRTFADAAQQTFIRETDRAYNLASSGMISYTQAVHEAINTICADGVQVEYKDAHGTTYHKDTIETATLRCVRTGIAQATGDIAIARMDEMDWDIVLVSAHLGARYGDGGQNPGNHAWWQGKFYSRSGKDKRFPPFSETGYGTGEGLCGWNCRHSFGAGDGEFNPYENYDNDENRKAYDLSQRQRTLERRIRKTKRVVMGLKTALDNAPTEQQRAELDRDYQRKAALLQKQNQAYTNFCEENSLKRLNDRIQIAKWDRKQAAAARGAARRCQNEIQKKAGSN